MDKHKNSKRRKLKKHNKKHNNRLSNGKSIKFTHTKYSPNKFRGQRLKRYSYRKNNTSKQLKKLNKHRIANSNQKKKTYKGGSRIRVTRRKMSHGTNKILTDIFGSFNPTKRAQAGGGIKSSKSCKIDRDNKQLYTKPLMEIIKKDPKHKGIIGWVRFKQKRRKEMDNLEKLNRAGYHLFYSNCYRNLMKEIIKEIASMIQMLIKVLTNNCDVISKLGNTPYFNMIMHKESDFMKTYDDKFSKNKDDAQLILRYYDIFKYDYDRGQRNIHKKDEYNNRSVIATHIKNYYKNVLKIRKNIKVLKKCFAAAIDIHNIYTKNNEKLNEVISELSGFINDIGGAEVSIAEAINTTLDKEFGTEQTKIDELDEDEDIDFDMMDEEPIFDLDINFKPEDLANLETTDEFYSTAYSKLLLSTRKVQREYELKTFIPNKYLWAAASFKKMYQTLQKLVNRNNEVFPEYVHQKISKLYMSPDYGYSLVMLKHPKDTSKYYLPEGSKLGAKRKSVYDKILKGSGAKFKDIMKDKFGDKDEKHMSFMDRKITLEHIEIYKSKYDDYKELWAKILNSKLDDKTEDMWIENSTVDRNAVTYVMKNTLDTLLNTVVGHSMKLNKGEKSGEAYTIIPGLLGYFINTLCQNMPIPGKHSLSDRIRKKIHTHNVYETSFIVPVYKPITPFARNDTNISQYNSLFSINGNSDQNQMALNKNKFNLLSDVNSVYSRYKIIPFIHSNPTHTNRRNNLNTMLTHGDMLYPTHISHDFVIANPIHKAAFYRGYLMDRQYVIFAPVDKIQNETSSNQTDPTSFMDPNIYDIDSFNICNKGETVYHWAGKPKYIDGIIEYPCYIDNMIADNNNFGHINHPHDIAFSKLENPNGVKLDITTVNYLYDEKHFADNRTISNDYEHLHKNILNNQEDRIINFTSYLDGNTKHETVKVKTHLHNNVYFTPVQMERSIFTETDPNILYFLIVNCLHFTKYFQNIYDQNITDITDFNGIPYVVPNKINNPKNVEYYLNYFNLDPNKSEDNGNGKGFKALEYDNYGFIEMRHLTRLKEHNPKNKIGHPFRFGDKCFDYEYDGKKKIGVKPPPEVYQKYLATQYNNNNSTIFLTTPFFSPTPDITRPHPLMEINLKPNTGSNTNYSMNYNMPFKIYQIPYYRQERDARYLSLLGHHRHNYVDNNLRIQNDSTKFDTPIDFIPNYMYRIQAYLEHVNQSMKDLSIWLPFRNNVRHKEISQIDPFYTKSYIDKTNYYVPPGCYQKDGFFSLYHHDLEDRLMLYKSPIEFFNHRPTDMLIYHSDTPCVKYLDPYNMMKYPHYYCSFGSNRFHSGAANDPYDVLKNLSMMAVISKPSVLVEILFLYILQTLNINLYDEIQKEYEDNDKYNASDVFLNEYLTMLYYIFIPTILVGKDINYEKVELGPLTAVEKNSVVTNTGIKYEEDDLKDIYYRPIFKDTMSKMYDYLSKSPGGAVSVHNNAKPENVSLTRFKSADRRHKYLGNRCTFNVPFLPSVQSRNPMIVAGVNPTIKIDTEKFRLLYQPYNTPPGAEHNSQIYDIIRNELTDYFKNENGPTVDEIDNMDGKYNFDILPKNATGDFIDIDAGGPTHQNVHDALKALIEKENNIGDLEHRKYRNYKLLLLDRAIKRGLIKIEGLDKGIWDQDEHPELLPPELRIKYPECPYIDLSSFGRRNNDIHLPMHNDVFIYENAENLRKIPDKKNQDKRNLFVDCAYKPLMDVVTDMTHYTNNTGLQSDDKLRCGSKDKPANLNTIKFNVDVTQPWRNRFAKALKDIIVTGDESFKSSLHDIFIVREHEYQSPNIKLHCSVRAQKFIERYLTMYETVELKDAKDAAQFPGHDTSIAVEVESRDPVLIPVPDNNIYHRMTDPYKKNAKNLHLMNLYNSEPIYPQAYPDVNKYFPLGLGPFYDNKLYNLKTGYSTNYIPDDSMPKEKYITLEKLFKQPIQMNRQNAMSELYATDGLAEKLNMGDFEWSHRTSQDHYQLDMNYPDKKHFIPIGRQADFDFPWEYACDYNKKMDDINKGFLPVSQLVDIVEDINENNKHKEVKHNWAMNYKHKPVYVMNGLFLPDNLQLSEHTELKQFFNEDFSGSFEIKIDNTGDNGFNNVALLDHFQKGDIFKIDPISKNGVSKSNTYYSVKIPDRDALIKERKFADELPAAPANNTEFDDLPTGPNLTYRKAHQYFNEIHSKVKNSSFRHLGFLPSGLHPHQVKKIGNFLSEKRKTIGKLEIEIGKKVIGNILEILKFHKKHLTVLSRSMRQNTKSIQTKEESQRQLTQSRQKIGDEASRADSSEPVKFSMQNRVLSNQVVDGTSQKFFKLTEDIMLYFVADKEKRHLFSYTELLNVMYELTDLLIDNIIAIAETYGFKIPKDTLVGVYSLDKNITYEDTMAYEDKKYITESLQGFNFNSMYIEIMALFQRGEEDIKSTSGLTNPEQLVEATKATTGVNIINYMYINKIKNADYSQSTLGDIRHKYLTKLKELKLKQIKKEKDGTSGIYTSTRAPNLTGIELSKS